MKAFLLYWTMGCAVVGLPLGQLMTECPGAKIETYEVVGMVSVWPTIAFTILARIGQPPSPKTKCGVPT